MVTLGGTVVGTASAAGGAMTSTAPFGTLNIWSYGSPGSSAGTFSVDLSGGVTDLYTTAQGVGPSGTTYAYAYVVPIATAGAYQATAGDLQFPAQLAGLGFAVAQGGKILQQSATASTLKFNAAAGNLVLLADAQAPTSGGATTYGLFDINVQATAGSDGLVFDKTQDVNSATGSLFNSQALVLDQNASFDATLADLKFPQSFASLGLVVSQGANVLGKIFGGGTFSFNGTPGTYQLTFVATPGTPTASATDPNPIALPFGLYATSVVYSPPTVTLTSNVSSCRDRGHHRPHLDLDECQQLHGDRRQLHGDSANERHQRAHRSGGDHHIHPDLHGHGRNRQSIGHGHRDPNEFRGWQPRRRIDRLDVACHGRGVARGPNAPPAKRAATRMNDRLHWNSGV